MTVSAQNQVNGMMRFDVVENVRRMRQQQRKSLVGARRNASKIGSMERGIIDSDDYQLSPSCWDNRTLIHQERDLVPIGQFGILCYRHTAVMVVIA
jgi:hypothetical protein